MKARAKISPKIIVILLLLINGVKISGMEMPPTVSNISYCENETAFPLTAMINIQPPYININYDLRWYESESMSSYSTTAPIPLTYMPGITTYWVSQYNRETNAESLRAPLIVTVYAKPDLIITDPAPVCERTVDIRTTWQVSNDVYPVTAGYYNADGVTLLTNPDAVSTTGTYYIQTSFAVPAVSGKYCQSAFYPVNVDIQNLSEPFISGSATTCPGASVNLFASTTSLVDSYTWSGTNGDTGSSSSFISSSLYSNTSFTVTAIAGACSKTSNPHNVMIENGQIIGSMSITESGNTGTPTYTALDEVEFYSCGGVISVNANYNYTTNDFEWRRVSDNQVLSNSNALNIMQAQGTEKYRLTYTNECPVSVMLTIHSISMINYGKLPAQSVCNGDGATIGLEWVSPPTTTLKWLDPDGTIFGPNNGMTVNAIPPYNPGVGHSSKYTYTIEATNDYCSTTIPIEVYVDEPLLGVIEAASPICEGNSIMINASMYSAENYIWTSSAFTGQKLGSKITESPVETTTYYLYMTRGACEAYDDVTIEVGSRPRIATIDSLGVRIREIVPLPGYGTLPFIYGVNDMPVDSDPIKRDLSFGVNTFYIEDATGCYSFTQEYFLADPDSPNSSASVTANTSIEIYPNPFTDKLEIEKAANYNLMVTDMQGHIQYQRANLKDNETIKTSSWAAGVYIINLSSQDNNIVRRVVKY